MSLARLELEKGTEREGGRRHLKSEAFIRQKKHRTKKHTYNSDKLNITQSKSCSVVTAVSLKQCTEVFSIKGERCHTSQRSAVPQSDAEQPPQ